MRWDKLLTLPISQCPEACSGRGFCVSWLESKDEGRPWCHCLRGFEVRGRSGVGLTQRRAAQLTARSSRIGRGGSQAGGRGSTQLAALPGGLTFV